MNTDREQEKKLHEIQELVNCYFEPWGAGKAAQWEDLTGDGPFSASVALSAIQKIITQ